MVVLEVSLPGLLAPTDLPRLLAAAQAAVPAGGREGVVLSGRLPVWAFAALAHHYHPRPWVATFDPRLNGAVVVESHLPDGPSVGTVMSLDGATTVQVTL
jgi:CRISPR-associated protein Csx3